MTDTRCGHSLLSEGDMEAGGRACQRAAGCGGAGSPGL